MIDRDAGENMKLLAKKHKSFYSRYKATYEDDESPRKRRKNLLLENSRTEEEQDQQCCPDDSFLHSASTLGLILLAYAVGISVPGVAVVWSVVGSSMALVIGFTIPTACYLRIRNRKRLNPRSLSAWVLLIFSIIASFVCTAQTLNRIHAGE
jgi:amino acid permease